MTLLQASRLPDRVPLDAYGLVCYYSLPIIAGAFAFMCVYRAVIAIPDHGVHGLGEWWGALLCVLFAGGLTWALRRRLRFTVLDTAQGALENFSVIAALCEDKEWRVHRRAEGILIQARVQAQWTDFTWGELVTVMFFESKVAVNCIGDPYSPGVGSRLDSSRVAAEMKDIAQALRVI